MGKKINVNSRQQAKKFPGNLPFFWFSAKKKQGNQIAPPLFKKWNNFLPPVFLEQKKKHISSNKQNPTGEQHKREKRKKKERKMAPFFGFPLKKHQ